MQNSLNNSEDVLNTIPEHFPTTTPPDDTDNTNSNSNSKSIISSPSAAERSQNFSFSSSYTASRFGNSLQPNYRLGTPLTTTQFEFKPITAFTVPHRSNLAATYIATKPNAIVRPFQRPEQPLPGSLHTNATDATDPELQHQPEQSQRMQTSSVTRYGNVGNGTMRKTGQDVRFFAEELNRKLRFLHTTEDVWTRPRDKMQDGNNQESSLIKRPLFITTVPTGVFLPPARDLPLPPTLRRHTYAYSSHPVVFHNGYNNKSNTKTNGYNYIYNKTNNNNNTTTFSKDKLRSKTAPIGSADKDNIRNTLATTATVTTTSTTQATNLNRIRDMQGGGIPRGEPAVDHTHPLLGSVQITKQQFQQQIQQNRTKRETPVEPYKNVMFEKRVIRGSNFTSNLMADIDPFDKAAELRRRQALRKRTQCRNQRNILGTPPPVKGRRHEVIQTEKYLEELVQRPPEMSVDTQTDLFLERPPTPPYIPAKVGKDASTEIGEGELFHFDAEAQPIIEILVDTCIEQSMLEVAHEQEIDALRKKQEEFLAHREAELAELRRLEAEEMRLRAEKERRLRQDAIAKELDDEMQKGVTAAKLLQGHIAGLLPEVLENLEPATDSAKKEQLMKTICPWLTQEVAEEVGQIVDSREILTVIIQEIIKQRAAAYAGYKEDLPEGVEIKELGEEEGQCDLVECCEPTIEENEGCTQDKL